MTDVTTAHCNIVDCGWQETWSTTEAAQAAATWHAWEAHLDRWVEIIGSNREPNHLLPMLLGRLCP